MAIYHLSAKVAVQKTDGKTSTAAAAYRAGVSLTDENNGEVHNYSRKKGVLHSRLMLPGGNTAERGEFWSKVDKKNYRQGAVCAREFVVALPSELSDDEKIKLAQDYASDLIERYGVAVDLAVHAPSARGDDRNTHAHLLLTYCRVNLDGTLGRKCEALDPHSCARQKPALPNPMEVERPLWQERCNSALEAAGYEDRIDHRSLKAQAEEAEAQGDYTKAIVLTRTPTRHMGKAATAVARKQDDWIDRGIFQRETIIDNRKLLNDYLDKAENEGRLMDESRLHSRIAALAERQREAQARVPLQRFLDQLATMETEADTTPVDDDNIFRRSSGIDPFAEPKPGGIEEQYAKEFEAQTEAFDLEQLRPPQDPSTAGDVATGDILPPPPKDADDILPPPPKDDIEVPAPKAAIDVFKEHIKKAPSGSKRKGGNSTAPAARLSSSKLRLTRATGAGAEVINAQTAAIEEWLASMLEASKAYLDSIQDIGGVPEIQFLDAVDAMNIHRVGGYWHKPMLREDMERLVGATNTYIHAVTRLSRREDAARRALNHLSEVQTEVNQQLIAHPRPGRDATRKEVKAWEKWKGELKARWEAASKAYRDAKRMLVDKAKRYYEKQTDLARTDMVDETQRFERLYPIPIPIAPEDEIYLQPFKPAPDSDRTGMDHKPQGPRSKPDTSRYPKLRPPH